MSLLSAAERLAALDRSRIELNAQRCLRAQGKGQNCSECASLCPVDAISIEDLPRLDEEECQSCLMCLTSCPVGAFTGEDAVGDLLQCAARLENDRLELMCDLHASPERGLEGYTAVQTRGCLSALGRGGFLALAGLGLREIAVRVEGCKECPWSVLEPRVFEVIDQVNRLLTIIGSGTRIQAISETGEFMKRTCWDAADPPLTRRDMFHLAARRGQLALAKAMNTDIDSRGKTPGRDRRRITSALDQFDENLGKHKDTLPLKGYAEITVSQECSACKACARVCPTGALQYQLQDNGSRFRMTFSARNCIVCKLCLGVCSQQAIEITPNPSIAAVFNSGGSRVLVDSQIRRCKLCNTRFASDGSQVYCPVCKFRKDNPLGSKMPPQVGR